MTNLNWIIKHTLAEVVADAMDTALSDYSDEAARKLYAIKWLFEERLEVVKNDELTEITHSHT